MTNGNCVEVAGLAGEFIGVRDSVNPGGTILGFSRGGGTPLWAAFATASSIVVDNRFGSQRFVGVGRY